MKRAFLTAGILASLLLLPAGLPATEDKVTGEPAELSKQALAILQERCGKCHGGEKPKAKLDLTSPEQISRGSKGTAVVVPGKPDDSLLWRVVGQNKMPPKKPLPDADRLVLKRWIEMGSPGLPVQEKNDWAYHPPVRPLVPKVRNTAKLRTDVDAFIEASLEKKDLTFGPEADRATLIRRVSFDLTGLPPSLSAIDEFVADKTADAYEKMVERYLASPYYGERWGKYWLDAAGYAESNGYFSADSDRPLAYRYRDYVIRSFNLDKPYDQFVREQLAGDEIIGYSPDDDVTPAMEELLTATHFLRNAPDGTAESDGNPDEVRTDRFSVLEGNLQNTMNCLLGITIQCARCHDHKFEPISQEEYYRLQAIFYPAYCPDRWTKPAERVVAVAPKAQREQYQKVVKQIDKQIQALKESLEKIAQPLREQLVEERLMELEPAARDNVRKAVNTPEDKRTEEQKGLIKLHEKALKPSDEEIVKRFKEYAGVRDQINQATASREKEKPMPLKTLSVFVETDPKPPVHHVLTRGLHNAPGKEVEPGVPAALCAPGNIYHIEDRPEGRVSTGRRSAFAKWVTAKENPLFARVMVNRIWQHHFGLGLVATPDNLGRSGAKPSHPELLDYLATEFIRTNWSVKALHKLFLNSAVYRQESRLSGQAFKVDPDNQLLWRFPLRRLDAEALRDGMLAVSGEIDLKMGGPYIPTRRNEEGSVVIDEKTEGAHRRSVYLQQRRTQVLTLLELFDAPSLVTNCSKRTMSTVPLQSLALLNSDFARARAAAFARRLEGEAKEDEKNRMALAYRLAFGRDPNVEEGNAAQKFLTMQKELYAREKDASHLVWTDLCQMIMAANGFLYVE
ncbi:MAG: PSD1 and planctomycete cytochrome C domain-containing protein [Gemmataceae bacterium]